MHIPDGFLNPTTTVATLTVSGVVLGTSLKHVNQSIKPEQIPLMGLLASFVFLIQLFSFPIFGGTSVHLTGALLVSILLGPRAGFIISSVSLLALALLFQHGGIFSLGANILNMAFVGCFLAYWIYSLIPGQLLSILLASLFAAVASALLCASELALSDMFEFSSGFKTMGIVYGITGIIEGVITFLIINFLKRVKPEMLGQNI